MVWPCGSRTVVFNITQTCAFIRGIIAALRFLRRHENPPEVVVCLQVIGTPHGSSARLAGPAAHPLIPNKKPSNTPSADRCEIGWDRRSRGSPGSLFSGIQR